MTGPPKLLTCPGFLCSTLRARCLLVPLTVACTLVKFKVCGVECATLLMTGRKKRASDVDGSTSVLDASIRLVTGYRSRSNTRLPDLLPIAERTKHEYVHASL